MYKDNGIVSANKFGLFVVVVLSNAIVLCNGLVCRCKLDRLDMIIRKMVRPERVELPTFWFVARRSIQLSYGRITFI